MTRRRNRATWRLTDENMDWLCKEARRLGKLSGIEDVPLNAALNVVLEKVRQADSPVTATPSLEP